MAEKISLREFGRRVDLSGEGVRKAIQTGRIPAEFVGEIELKSGRKRPCIVNPAQAAKLFDVMTNPVMQRDRKQIGASMKKAHARRRGEEAADDGDDAAAATAAKELGGVPAIAKSNAIKAAYQARREKLAYEKEVGKLVNAEAIKAKMVGMITGVKGKLRGVPTKAKTRIPTLTVDDIEILEDLIDEALEELASGG